MRHQAEVAEVRIEPTRVLLEKGMNRLEARGKWVSFYALLSSEPHRAAVDVGDLLQYAPWSAQTARTAGREVTRHIERLRLAGLQEVVEFEARAKTTSWRLGASVRVETTIHELSEWLQERWKYRVDTPSSRWVLGCVQGFLEFQAGQTKEACQTFIDASKGRQAPARIARFFAFLAAERSGIEIEEKGVSAEDWGSDPVGRAIQARVAARRAFEETENPRAAMPELTRSASRLLKDGDFSSAGIVLNYLGVLARRDGQFERAERLLQEAVGYLLLAGNVWYLQAALFNLCHGRYVRQLKEAQGVDEETVNLLKLECEFRKRHRLGMDSAQTEIVLASIYRSRGDLGQASIYLDYAYEIIAKHHDKYDLGCWLLQRGQLHQSRGELQDALQSFREAKRLLAETGHLTAEVDEFISSLTSIKR